MFDYSQFISKYYPDASKKQIGEVKGFLTNFFKLLGDNDASATLRNSGFLCKTFYLHDTNSMSRAQYFKIKKNLLNLFDYYGVQSKVPPIDDVIESHDIDCFFKDLDDVLQFVDSVGEARIRSYDPEVDLNHIKSIIILGWYGFSSEEIASLPLSNVTMKDNRYGVYHLSTSEFVPIRESDYTILASLGTIEHYRGLPSGKLQIVKGDSSLLIRSVRSDSASPQARIFQLLKRFNAATFGGSKIIFRHLSRNAEFVAIREDKQPITLVNKIIEHTRCNQNQAYTIKRQYALWLKKFYNEEI